MPTLTPDQTFYPYARDAMRAPRERLAYAVTLNTGADGERRPDAMCVLDVDPQSATYGQTVGRLDFPHVGDELHHFGWNACSAALCPWAAHPHVERRYLLVPGLRSSRIHVIDVGDVTRDRTKMAFLTGSNNSTLTVYRIKEFPTVFRDGQADTSTYPDVCYRYSGPKGGHYASPSFSPDGGGPGGVLLLDHETLELKGPWERERGPQELAYDFWWHLNLGTVVTSEWGTPKMVEDGLQGDLLQRWRSAVDAGA